MRIRESPNIPFTIMYERLKQGIYLDGFYTLQIGCLFSAAPATIIYDNACNLHNYCMNREAHFFKRSRFFVDRFHWRNHTGVLSNLLTPTVPLKTCSLF